MTDQIKQALEALKLAIETSYSESTNEVFNAAIAALEGLDKVEPFGTVTVVKREGCVDMHWFYRWPEPPYIDNAAEVHRVYTHPAPVQAEPAGWKLVPVEPTQEMHDAARAALAGGSAPMPKVYRAMLNAAPQPAAQVVGLTDEQIYSLMIESGFEAKDFARAIEAAHGIKPPEKGGSV